MRIGILIKEFEDLENWELRVIDNIKNNQNFELTLLIKDGRGISKNLKPNYTLGEFILKKQILIEKNRYLNNTKSVNKTDLLEFLNNIPSIQINPISKGKIDTFKVEDSQRIQEYNLDVILKHGFNNLSGGILNVAKKGIWLLSHSDLSLNRGGICGFWEVLLNKPIIAVSILKLSSHLGKGNIIDKAFYNRNLFSSVITNNIVKESSVSLLLKNLKKLSKNEDLVTYDIVNFDICDETPNLYYTCKYLFNFYTIYALNKIKSIIISSDIRKQCWTLFIGKGNFMETDLSKLKSAKVPSNEFWADPFLFNYKNVHYVFFESYSYITKKGKICCGRVENDRIVDVIDVLDLTYHLSYPYIFEERGEIFMMPETGENKRLEIYKSIGFPNKWELYSSGFEGESVQDTTLYIDEEKQKWLFLNKVIDSNVDRTSELYIYKIDSLKLNTIEAHKDNPVIIDSRVARNGGAIFEYKGKIYRPSQSNTDGIYGKALNINLIKKLTIDEYEEETIRKVESNFKKELVSIHHLHQIEGMFIFDAAYKSL
jgi:hypothetical protein